MGWKVLSLNINVGVGHVEPIGTASSILLVSPNGDRFVFYDNSKLNKTN